MTGSDEPASDCPQHPLGLDLNFHGAFGPSEDGGRLEGSIEYSRPPADATVAWLDIFPVDFDVVIHVSRDWTPDDDYLDSRISS